MCCSGSCKGDQTYRESVWFRLTSSVIRLLSTTPRVILTRCKQQKEWSPDKLLMQMARQIASMQQESAA
jgi:hypothetical protein